MSTNPADTMAARGFPPVALDERIACRTTNPNLFYPPDHRGSGRGWDHDAKRICQPCPVRQACLMWALDTEQEHGVWGGLNGHQRRLARRLMRREHCTAEQAARFAIAHPDLIGASL